MGSVKDVNCKHLGRGQGNIALALNDYFIEMSKRYHWVVA